MFVVDIFMRRTHNVNVSLSTIKLQQSSKGFTSGLLNVVYRTGRTAYNIRHWKEAGCVAYMMAQTINI